MVSFVLDLKAGLIIALLGLLIVLLLVSNASGGLDKLLDRFGTIFLR